MSRLALALASALLAFPSFTIAVYGECCTSPGGCQNPGAGPLRPCCAERGPCCTPTIVSVKNLVDAAVLAPPHAAFGVDSLDVVRPCDDLLRPFELVSPRLDPAHLTGPPAPLFILHHALLR